MRRKENVHPARLEGSALLRLIINDEQGLFKLQLQNIRLQASRPVQSHLERPPLLR